MEMLIDFPGGVRVDAHFNPHTVSTDQPLAAGGEGSAPAPFDLFLASIGTCAGFYALSFCRQRGLPTEGLRLLERVHTDPASGMIRRINLEIELPPGFPEKYRPAIVRAAELCAVKKHLEAPPEIKVTAKA